MIREILIDNVVKIHRHSNTNLQTLKTFLIEASSRQCNKQKINKMNCCLRIQSFNIIWPIMYFSVIRIGEKLEFTSATCHKQPGQQSPSSAWEPETPTSFIPKDASTFIYISSPAVGEYLQKGHQEWSTWARASQWKGWIRNKSLPSAVILSWANSSYHFPKNMHLHGYLHTWKKSRFT